MFLKKLEWAYRLLRSRTYVVLTDKSAVVNIPLAKVDSFENSLLLAGQASSLATFKDKLEDLISEHEQAIRLLNHRQGGSYTQPASIGKRASGKNGDKVRKAPKA